MKIKSYAILLITMVFALSCGGSTLPNTHIVDADVVSVNEPLQPEESPETLEDSAANIISTPDSDELNVADIPDDSHVISKKKSPLWAPTWTMDAPLISAGISQATSTKTTTYSNGYNIFNKGYLPVDILTPDKKGNPRLPSLLTPDVFSNYSEITTSTTSQALTETHAAYRLDAAFDRNRSRSVVVFERNKAGSPDGYREIVARFYDRDGQIIPDGERIITRLADNSDDDRLVDINFHQVPLFANMTEPECFHYSNPSVVFVPGDTVDDDTYVIAYEATCKALVNWPNGEQFFDNPSPSSPVFDLDDTVQMDQEFHIIKAYQVSAADLSVSDQGLFRAQRAMGRVAAWFLPNTAGENNGHEMSDRSVWKWSDARNPHVSVHPQTGNVLLTYQTNLKYTTCLNSNATLGSAVQQSWYDDMYSIDSQVIVDGRRSAVKSIYRSSLVMPDGEETNPRLWMCSLLSASDDVQSAYHPVAASMGNGFLIGFSTENGSVENHNGQQENPLMPKTVMANQLKMNAIDDMSLSVSDTEFMWEYDLDPSISQYANSFEETVHIVPDMMRIDDGNAYAIAFADGDGVHVRLLDATGQLMDDTVYTGANFIDPIAENGFYPRLSVEVDDSTDEMPVWKLGVSYQQKSSDGRWDSRQNYMRVHELSFGDYEVALERSNEQIMNLSNQLAQEIATPMDDIGDAFSSVPLYMGTGERGQRFRTFWISEHMQSENNDNIYSVFVPEGANPESSMRVRQSGARQWQLLENNDRINILVSDIASNPLILDLDGSLSRDDDALADASNQGIEAWSWEINGMNTSDYSFVTYVAQPQVSNADQPISDYGMYSIRLKVMDADGMVNWSVGELSVIENMRPVVESVSMQIDDHAAIELPGNIPPIALGAMISMDAMARDRDSEPNFQTQPQDLLYRWTIQTDDRELLAQEGIGLTHIDYELTELGVHYMSLIVVDKSGGESQPFTAEFDVISYDITRFDVADGSVVDIHPESLPSGTPYGIVNLEWDTRLIDSLTLYQQIWQNGQPGIRERVPGDNFILDQKEDLPLQTALPVQVRVYQKTTLILVGQNGDNSTERELTVAFREPHIVAFNDDHAGSPIDFEPDTGHGQVVLEWQSEFASHTQSIVAIGEDGSRQAVSYIDSDDPQGIEQGHFPPLTVDGIGRTIVQPIQNTRYELTLANPDGLTVNQSLDVAFNAPQIISWSIEEANGLPESPIHLSWQTRNTTQLELIMIRESDQLIIPIDVNEPSALSQINRFAVNLPDFAQNERINMALRAIGPGGNTMTVQTIPLELIVVDLRILSFSSNVPAGQGIDLVEQSTQGHPNPSDVYGEVILRWDTVGAAFVRIYDEDGLIVGARLEDNGFESQVDHPLSLQTGEAGFRVRVHHNTTLRMLASVTIDGDTFEISSELPIIFNSAFAVLQGNNDIAFDNSARMGNAELRWSTRNINRVRVFSCDLIDGNMPGICDQQELDGQDGILALLQNQVFTHAISHKTGYRLIAYGVNGDTIMRDHIVRFAAPEILSANADETVLNLVPDQRYGQTVLNWQFENAAQVVVHHDGQLIAYIDSNNPDQELDEFPLPDTEGRGSTLIRPMTAGTYRIIAINPDGLEAHLDMDISFHSASILLQVPASTEGDHDLLVGRPMQVSWQDAVNVSRMTLQIANENGEVLAGMPIMNIAQAFDSSIIQSNFIFPEVDNIFPDGKNYRMHATITDINNGADIIVLSDVFHVSPRPIPVIDMFAGMPAQIDALEKVGDDIIGRFNLSWNAVNADHAQPVASLLRRVGNNAFLPVDVDIASLSASGELPQILSAIDRVARYHLIVQNRFDDQSETGQLNGYNQAQAGDVTISFIAPQVMDASVVEESAYPERNINVSWQTQMATRVEVMLVRDGNAQQLLRVDEFGQLAQMQNQTILMPVFEGEGAAFIRVDAYGPGMADGEFASSELLPIMLRQIPDEGVFNFCIATQGNGCVNTHSIDFVPGASHGLATVEWVVNPEVTARVVRLCFNQAPDVNGACIADGLDLPEGANFEDLGNGNGIGSAEIQAASAMPVWLVTQPIDDVIDVAYAQSVQVNINAPIISTFNADHDTINQFSPSALSWNNIINAISLRLELTAGTDVTLIEDGNMPRAFPYEADENFEMLDSHSLGYVSNGAENVEMTLVAIGPGGETRQTILVTVNDVPLFPASIVSPISDAGLYAPTRIFIDMMASEQALDDDQAQASDQDMISFYGICYQAYRSDENGAILDPDGNKENDRIAGVGSDCPDVINNRYATVDALPEGVILLASKPSDECTGFAANCEIINDEKHYTYSLRLDPKLNDPDNVELSEYIRYEFQTMVIDAGRNNLLGIRLLADSHSIVTDDSVVMWYDYEEDFTIRGPCSEDLPDHTVCDQGRHSYHGEPFGAINWVDGWAEFSPNAERDSWIIVDGSLPRLQQFTVESGVTLFDADNARAWLFLLQMGDPTDFNQDGAINVIIRDTPRLYLRMQDELTTGDFREIDMDYGGDPLATESLYNLAYTCDEIMSIHLNGVRVDDPEENLCQGNIMNVGEYPSDTIVGAAFHTPTMPVYRPFEGRMNNIIVYDRPLSDADLANKARIEE